MRPSIASRRVRTWRRKVDQIKSTRPCRRPLSDSERRIQRRDSGVLPWNVFRGRLISNVRSPRTKRNSKPKPSFFLPPSPSSAADSQNLLSFTKRLLKCFHDFNLPLPLPLPLPVLPLLLLLLPLFLLCRFCCDDPPNPLGLSCLDVFGVPGKESQTLCAKNGLSCCAMGWPCLWYRASNEEVRQMGRGGRQRGEGGGQRRKRECRQFGAESAWGSDHQHKKTTRPRGDPVAVAERRKKEAKRQREKRRMTKIER